MTDLTPNRRLVTIVAEGFLKPRLLVDMLRLGATGYTVTSAHGSGSRGLHTEEFEGANARIEVIVSAETAAAILAHLEGTYFADYSIVAWATEVHVSRPAKYG